MQRRRKQQLLTCNTPTSKGCSCFITYSVWTGKKQETRFFTLFISSLSFTLLIMLLNNLPNTLDGLLSCICTQVSIKVETYYFLPNPKLKITIYICRNPKWFERYIPNCILFSFLFLDNNSVTINKSRKWATIHLFHPYSSLEF